MSATGPGTAARLLAMLALGLALAAGGSDDLPDTVGEPLDGSLDIDGNGRVESTFDGALVLRWLFGLRGEPLIANAVDVLGSRKTVQAIEDYLGESVDLDIDADGRAHALTDGLLLLRWLDGRRGQALTDQTLGAGAARSDPDAIALWLAPRTTRPRFALAYGPYRGGQAPGGQRPTGAQLAEDLDRIAAQTDLIRTYGACAAELAEVAELAQTRGLRLWQGAALGPMSSEASNDAEIACLADLAGEHDSIVAGIIGGELLLRGDLTEQAIIGYLEQAREAAPNLPLATSDTWFEWCNAQDGICRSRPALAGAGDLIVAHAHPYWEGLPVEHGAAAVIAEYAALRGLYPDRPVVIGETGWPSAGAASGRAVPSRANQRRFAADLWRLSRRYRVPLIWFEAFDEPWKAAAEGEVGTYWGLHDVARAAKHPDLDWSLPQPLPELPVGAISIDYPAVGKTVCTKRDLGLPVFGRAAPATTGGHVRLEVFTDAWYRQTLWYPDAKVPVSDGLWGMPAVILGGTGAFNNHRIRATLFDAAGVAVSHAEIAGIVVSDDCGD